MEILSSLAKLADKCINLYSVNQSCELGARSVIRIDNINSYFKENLFTGQI